MGALGKLVLACSAAKPVEGAACQRLLSPSCAESGHHVRTKDSPLDADSTLREMQNFLAIKWINCLLFTLC